MKVTAIIPARSGSKRVKDKNIRSLAGHPLIAHSISSAEQSGVFENIFVATDSQEYAEISKSYGADAPVLRPNEISSATSPDIQWVLWAIQNFSIPKSDHAIAILRPTSPFRTAQTIKRAGMKFMANDKADSLRAVSPVTEHPGKMWAIEGDFMMPLMPMKNNDAPWHSSQLAALPQYYVQNASLEIAKVESILRTSKISGDLVLPFISEDYEGYDINTELDFLLAELLIDKGLIDIDFTAGRKNI